MKKLENTEINKIAKILKEYARNNMENTLIKEILENYKINLEKNINEYEDKNIKKYKLNNYICNLKSQREIVSDISKKFDLNNIEHKVIKGYKNFLNENDNQITNLEYYFIKVKINKSWYNIDVVDVIDNIQYNGYSIYFLVSDLMIKKGILAKVGQEYSYEVIIEKECEEYFKNEYAANSDYKFEENELENIFKNTIYNQFLKTKIFNTRILINKYYETNKYLKLYKEYNKYEYNIKDINKKSLADLRINDSLITFYLSIKETKIFNEVLNSYNNKFSTKDLNFKNYIEILKNKDKIRKIVLRLETLKELEENLENYIELTKNNIHIRVQVKELFSYYDIDNELVKTLKEINRISILLNKEYRYEVQNIEKLDEKILECFESYDEVCDYAKLYVVYKFIYNNFIYDDLDIYLSNINIYKENEYFVKYLQESQRITRLKKGFALCTTYSAFIHILLSKLNVKSKIIEGRTKEFFHIWNKIKVGKNWYNLDYTFDERTFTKKRTNGRFLNCR